MMSIHRQILTSEGLAMKQDTAIEVLPALVKPRG